MRQYRHGDLLIVEVEALSPRSRPTDEKVLAYGEVTGHAHRLQSGQLMLDGDDTFVRLEQPALLTHEEHDTIELPAGLWRVIRQREYTPARPRWVED